MFIVLEVRTDLKFLPCTNLDIGNSRNVGDFRWPLNLSSSQTKWSPPPSRRKSLKRCVLRIPGNLNVECMLQTHRSLETGSRSQRTRVDVAAFSRMSEMLF